MKEKKIDPNHYFYLYHNINAYKYLWKIQIQCLSPLFIYEKYCFMKTTRFYFENFMHTTNVINGHVKKSQLLPVWNQKILAISINQ